MRTRGMRAQSSLDPMPNIDIESVMTSTSTAAAAAHIERCDCQNPMTSLLLLGEQVAVE